MPYTLKEYNRCVSSKDRGSQLPISLFKPFQSLSMECTQHHSEWEGCKYSNITNTVTKRSPISELTLPHLLNFGDPLGNIEGAKPLALIKYFEYILLSRNLYH